MGGTGDCIGRRRGITKGMNKESACCWKKGQYTQETDYNQYLGKLAAKCTVFPNRNDKELQDSYHVMGADLLLKAMLTAGKYQGILRGFSRSMVSMQVWKIWRKKQKTD